jgi:parallel beta-helix repeat protein
LCFIVAMPQRQSAYVAILVVSLSAIVLLSSLGTSFSAGTSEASVESWFWEDELAFPEISVGNEGGVCNVAMGNLTLYGEIGEPLLPCESVLVPIPAGFSVIGVYAEFTDLETVGPIGPIASCIEEIPISGNDDPESIYANPISPQKLFPDDRVELVGVQMLHGSSYVMIRVFPAVYDSVTTSLTYAKEARLTLEAKPIDQELLLSSGDKTSNGMGIAPDPLSTTAEYVIITSSSLESSFEPLLEWKMERGSYSRDLQNITGEIVTIESITSNPQYWGDPRSHQDTGNDTQTQIRNFIIDYYQTKGTEYVLLAGDVGILPCREVRVIHSLTDYIPADAYFAGLDGSWDDDNDGIYGEGGNQGGGSLGEEADLLLEVNVGRATVDTSQEAVNFVSKVIDYEKAIDSPYLNSVLLVGEKLDSRPTWGADYKDEIRDETFPEANPEIEVRTLYEKDGTFSSQAFITAMNDGVQLINHIGHGDYDSFADLSISSVNSLSNDQYFILFSQACLIGGFDDNVDTIAEEFLCSENGAVAMLVNSREGWYSPGDTDGSSQQYDRQFFDAIFQERIRGLGPALVDAKTDLVPMIYDTGSMRWCFMTINLLGDPETQVHFVEERVHDATVLDVEVDEAFAGEECSIHALIGNLGEADEFGIPVELEIGGETVSSTNVDVSMNGTAEADLSWTPSNPGMQTLTVRTNLTSDNWTSNNEFSFQVNVVCRITGSEEIRDVVFDQDFAFSIEENGTLSIINSTLFINSTFQGPSFQVRGNLEIINSSLHFNVEHDLAIFCERGSSLIVEGANMEMLGPVSYMIWAEGALNLGNSSLSGGGLYIEGGYLTIFNNTFEDGEGGIHIANSSGVDIDILEAARVDDAIVIHNSTGSIRSMVVENCSMGMSVTESSDLLIENCSILNCDEGLKIDRCTNLTLINNTLVDSTRDLSFNGTELEDFMHHMKSNRVSSGEVLYLIGEDDFTIEANSSLGYVAIVSCTNGALSELDLYGNGEGLLLVDSTSITVESCSFHDNTVGVRIIDSGNCSIIGNDFAANGCDADCDSNVSFNDSYERGGNFWDSYAAEDRYSGPDQNWPDADGIGDEPYQIPGTACVDNYPLMFPNTVTNSPPEARFDSTPSSPYTGDVVRFVDHSWDLDGQILNRTWDLGDGSVEYGDEVHHSYSESGNFTVTVWVMDNNRQWDSASKTITVQNRLPVAVIFSSAVFPEVNETISFTDGSYDPDGDIVSWLWELGDGTNTTEKNPSHSYSEKGTYTIKLTVWDDDGGSSSGLSSIVVGNEAPVADFSCSPADSLTLQEIYFQDLSYDIDGEIVGWSWDFGDGTHSSLKNPTHSYAQSGSYIVTLEVIDDSGEDSRASIVLQAINRPPTATFDVAPTLLFSGVEVSFLDLSIDSDGEIMEWYWDFGDGGVSNLRNPVHSYAESGNYTISLTVWDDADDWDITIMEVRVEDNSPIADFSISPVEVYSLMEVSFQDLSIDQNGNIVNWSWSFGDGTGSHMPSPNHFYDRPGAYQITLSVVDDQGFRSNITHVLEVLNLAPVSDFTWSFDHSSPYIVQLNSTSYDPDGNSISHHWHFGDGEVSTEVNPLHSFPQEGQYTVSLIVIDESENSSLVQKELWVRVSDLVLRNDSIGMDKTPVVGEVVTFSIMVMNSGSMDVEGATLEFTLDGLVENTTIFSLESGSNVSLVFEWVPMEGNHTIAFQIEAGVIEISEDNNIVSIEVDVESDGIDGSPDLIPILAIIALLGGGMVMILGVNRRSK